MHLHKHGVFGEFAVNPIIAVLYSHPQLRTFQFDFNFAPSSPTEAQQVEKIIEKFRYHSKPGLLNAGATLGNLIFKVPDKWKIEVMSNQGGTFNVNKRIPQIKECILEGVSVNYTPQNQFATFADDFPLSVQLRLQFKELQIITREEVEKGF